ncbi:hypothetical protein B0H19DRAFT_450062 [Mycena capillaripes]|nr:hypothetical protein B0H19DRAFT_450062 [Mycena capillaripes]
MVWIRPSTTQLCIELMAPAHNYLALAPIESGIRPPGVSFSHAPDDLHIIASISLQAYHKICYLHLARWHTFQISTNVLVKPGSIRHFIRPEYETSFEIAFAPKIVVDDRGWLTEDPMVDRMWNRVNGDKEGTSILENGWIRVNSSNIVDVYRRDVYADDLSSLAWLAQANNIFNSLGIQCNLEDYVMVYGILCQLRLLGPIDNLPPGCLFLSPLTDIQTKFSGHFRIPACAAYWSRNPSGAERLTAEEARNEGFPNIEFRMLAFGRTWDDRVYTGVRQFHQGKGFDPYSQEVTTELGYSLFQVSCEQRDLFAHLQGDTDDDTPDSIGVAGNNDSSESGDEHLGPQAQISESSRLTCDAELTNGLFRTGNGRLFDSEDEEYRSADSVAADIQNPQSDSEFHDAGGEGPPRAVVKDLPDVKSDLHLQDKSSQSEDVFQIHEESSDVCEEHVQNVSQYRRLGEADDFTPSRSWSIVICVQLALILTLSGFSLHNYVYSH